MVECVKETLGEYLKREREARRISLEDIPIATRISSPFIRALEENDFGFFSQKEAIPGYLKLYARHLGLDYDDVLRRYTIQSELNERSMAFQQLPLFLDFASPIKQVTEKKWSWRRHATALMITAVVAVTLTGASLYLYLVPGRAPDVEIREPVSPPAKKESLPAQPVLPPAPQAALPEPLAATPSSPPLNSPELAQAVARPVEANAAAVVDEEQAASAAQPLQKINRKKKVVGNRDSRRYHLPGMKYFDKVKAYHRVEFASEEEALKAGYSKARE